MKSENQKTVRNEEENNFNVENIFFVTIPQKWWFTQNSIGTGTNNYPAILKMFPDNKPKQPSFYCGPQSRRTDYHSELNISKKILTHAVRKRNEKIFFLCSILFSSMIILLISIFLSRHF